MTLHKLGPRQFATALLPPKRRARWGLAPGLLGSLLFHALLLSLAFGGAELGLPGLSLPWQTRRVEVPNLRVLLVPTRPLSPVPSEPKLAPLSEAAPVDELPAATDPPAEPSVELGRWEAAQTPVMALDRPDPSRWAVPVAASASSPLAAPARNDLPAALPVPVSVPDSQPAIDREARVLEQARLERAEQDAKLQAQRQAEQRAAQQALEQAQRLEAARAEALRIETERQEAVRAAAARQATAAQDDAARADAARQEAQRQESARQALASVEAARAEAARAELARAQAQRQEAARIEGAKQELARQELAKQELAKQELLRQEAARQELVRQEAQRQAERQATARQEAAQQEAARAETARQEAARQDAARAEGARLDAERAAVEQREARLRAIGRQLNEEADRRDAAAAAAAARQSASPGPALGPSASTLRRGRLFGRTDANAELILYAEAWARKIQLNPTLELVREALKQPYADPLVTVAIRSDGTVESVSFVRSSGVPALDEAIRRVVLGQANYPAFTPALAVEFDVVEIRRTWHFDTAIRLY